MKRSIVCRIGITLITSFGIANAKTIVVNTVNNADFSPGQTNLVYALQLLADGDTINFAVPGAGVHTIDTPADGYPLITKNNITIDGYSQQQPGSAASPNTASLHETNNAQITICLSSENGNALSMYSAVTNFAGIDYPNLGFGDSEQAILGFFRATNAWVKGIAFLAAPSTSTSQAAGGVCKTICFAVDASDVSSLVCQGFHVSGCWFGVDPVTRHVAYMPDGVTVATPAICIATYGTGTNGTPGFPNIENMPGPGTIGVAAGSTNPRAEFNVFVTGYGFDSQGGPFRICGNFWGVLPDGSNLADISTLNGGTQQGDAFVEFGSSDGILIGTDGDGVNDADEGNLFGSYASSGIDVYFYGSQGKTVIAGNSFGVDIHGNSFGAGQLTKLVHHFDHDDTCEARFGSDFNGVSDALEANTVADSVLFDIDSTSTTNSHWVSMRGNSLTNTATPFASRPPIGDGQTSSDGQDVYANFIDITGINGALDIIPIIGAGTTTTSLTGACGKPAAAPYTRLVVDLYEADPAVGSFTFDTTALAIAHGTKLTIAVTYSKDTKPAITTITRTGSLTSLTVTNSTGPNFGIQKSSTVNGAYAYTAVAANGSASFTDTNNPTSFYRATGPSATGQTSPFSDVFTVP
ncbi:MAG TPA: hypothetical protein VG146_02860 [Verrucomicrobiae bacterium]|nr:hypothetical protein [Verrucomicrobiae bacterium]